MHIRKMVISVLLTGLVTTLVACANYKMGSTKSTPASQQLVLDYIRLEKPTSSDDKIYLNIATYSSTKVNNDYQIPEAPLHWDANYLDQVKDLVLWEKSLGMDESMDFIISLIENDMPPWNPDELLGTVKLSVRSKNHHISSIWHADEDAVEVDSHQRKVHEYLMLGEHGRYVVGLKLKEKI